MKFISKLIIGLLSYTSLSVSSKDDSNNLIPFKEVETATTVSLEVKNTFQKSKFLTPKFKFAEYHVRDLSEETQNYDLVSIQSLPNGLLNKKLQSSAGFVYETETLADLVFIKSRFIGFGDSEVSVNSSLALSFPSILEIGKYISISQKQTTYPLAQNSNEYEVNTYCKRTKEYLAQEIDISLTGKSTELICNRDSSSDIAFAFLNDYGIALLLSIGNTFTPPNRYKYSDFKFTK